MAGGAPTSGAWQAWATRVLSGIGAPVNQTNYDTLWKWTQKEGTSAQNNYLATTQAASGASNFNSVGVKNYPTVDIGAQATAQTLQSGLYPNILSMFRNSVPGPQWSSAARYDLDTWAHGPHGAHGTAYPNFLGGAGSAPTTTGGTSAGPLGSGPADPFGIGTALGSFGTTVTNDLKRSLYFTAGATLILAGLAILTLLLLRGSAPAVSRVASKVTPQGRALKVLSGGRSGRAVAPKPAPAAPAAVTEPEYSAGGRRIEITPAARQRLRLRQQEQA